MTGHRRHTRWLGAGTALIATLSQASVRAADNAATTPTTSTTLGVQIKLPALYEPVVQSVGALAASGAAALKTSRSDVRTESIRAGLSRAMLAATGDTIVLDENNGDTALGEVTLLCAPREDYAKKAVYQSYLNTLVQNINAVSSKTVADSTIVDALKILFASSGYSIADNVVVDAKGLAELGAKNKGACEEDLKSYVKDYYGIEIPASHAAAAAAVVGGGGGGVY
jgi:hypothetical protein